MKLRGLVGLWMLSLAQTATRAAEPKVCPTYQELGRLPAEMTRLQRVRQKFPDLKRFADLKVGERYWTLFDRYPVQIQSINPGTKEIKYTADSLQGSRTIDNDFDFFAPVDERGAYGQLGRAGALLMVEDWPVLAEAMVAATQERLKTPMSRGGDSRAKVDRIFAGETPLNPLKAALYLANRTAHGRVHGNTLQAGFTAVSPLTYLNAAMEYAQRRGQLKLNRKYTLNPPVRDGLSYELFLLAEQNEKRDAWGRGRVALLEYAAHKSEVIEVVKKWQGADAARAWVERPEVSARLEQFFAMLRQKHPGQEILIVPAHSDGHQAVTVAAARVIAQKTQNLYKGALLKVERSPSTSQMAAGLMGRIANIQRYTEFGYQRGMLPETEGRVVVVVDDVMTSGVTLEHIMTTLTLETKATGTYGLALYGSAADRMPPPR